MLNDSKEILKEGQDMDRHEEVDRINRCKAIFISWTWMTIILSSLLIGGITLSWGASQQLSKIQERTIENRHKIDRLEESINNRLNLIIKMLEKE